MIDKKKFVITLVVIVVVVLLGWWGAARYRCRQRGLQLDGRVKKLKQDAEARLKPGTRKEDLLRFFAENNLPVSFSGSEAVGDTRTSGCSPFGCGSDDVLIGVSVKVDGSGTVESAPQVVEMYTNCL